MEESPLEVSQSKKIKVVGGLTMLLFDMCFFTIAIIDAHLNFKYIFDSSCSPDLVSVKIWTTVGYAVRVSFTIYLLATKFVNTKKFLENNQKFPKVGAVYTPFMSTLLLGIIVYDYNDCDEVSNIFSLDTANDLISYYSVFILVLIISFSVVVVFDRYIPRSRKRKIMNSITFILTFLIIFGALIGLLAIIELLNNHKVMIFLLFDLYSFAIMLLLLSKKLVRKVKNLRESRNN